MTLAKIAGERRREHRPVAMTTSDVTTTSLLPVLLDHISYSRDAEDICYDSNIKVLHFAAYLQQCMQKAYND